MKTLRVRDIMTTEVHTMDATASVAEAARALTEHRVSGAPVLDGRRIIGVVSKSDLIALGERSAVDQITVDAVMTRVIYAVRPGDPVLSAVHLMVSEQIHRVVVVDEHGALTGIVSSMDVLRALAEDRHVQDIEPSYDLERHSDPAVAVGYIDLRTFEVTR